MSDPKYLQQGFEKQLAHLIEECGEVLAAAGKTQRWGPYSVNPELPVEQREQNIHWLHREMFDLRDAIVRLHVTMVQAHAVLDRPLTREEANVATIDALRRSIADLEEQHRRLTERAVEAAVANVVDQIAALNPTAVLAFKLDVAAIITGVKLG